MIMAWPKGQVLLNILLGCLISTLLNPNACYTEGSQFENTTNTRIPFAFGIKAAPAAGHVQEPSSCDLEDVDYTICTTGNRMYRLLAYDVNNEVLSECYRACNESYPSGNDTDSCKVGCRSGVIADSQRRSELTNFASLDSLFYHAQMQQMLSHWMFEMVAGFDMFNDWYDSGGVHSHEPDSISTYVVVEQSDNQIRISSYRIDEQRAARITTTGDTNGDTNDLEPQNPYANSKDEDFETCFRRISYSRFILCLLLLTSGLFLIWLTCSTVTTSPKHRVKDTSVKKADTDDDKMVLKMLSNLPQGPVLVHQLKKRDDDEKMLLA